jgi:hypothetical protein
MPGRRTCPSIFLSISRFGVFNSRLSRFNSRLTRLRELARKGLIWLSVFAAEWQFRSPIDSFPGYFPSNELGRTTDGPGLAPDAAVSHCLDGTGWEGRHEIQ